jgi:hypothetical protein
MDGVLSDGQKGKLWFCKRHDGHALGLRVRVSTSDGFRERLLLFREAVPVEMGRLDLSAVKVKAKLDNMTPDVECEICGAMRTWWADKTALNILGTLYGKEKV